MELAALTRLAKAGLTNFSVMIPMARSLNEVEQVMDYLHRSPLWAEHAFDVWVKCETPALLILMDQLCDLDIAGVCFEVSALSQLIVGIDKANSQVGHHLDQTDEAVAQALEYAIATCRQADVASSLIAEQDHLRPEVVERAVQVGVTAVSVEPERLDEMRRLIVSVEHRILIDQVIGD